MRGARPSRAGLPRWALGLALAVASPGAPAAAQEAEPDQPVAAEEETRSALRSLIEQPVALIVTRRIVMPAVPLVDGGSVVVSGVGAFEPGREVQRTLGLRVDLTDAISGRAPTTHYLDLHEVEALLRALGHQDEIVREGRRDVVTETRFVTTEGFGVGVEIRDGRARHRVRGADGAWRELHAGPFGALRRHLRDARDRLFNAP